jgi:hypothetical protein
MERNKKTQKGRKEKKKDECVLACWRLVITKNSGTDENAVKYDVQA